MESSTATTNSYYIQQDLSQISKSKISSDRELENEITKICDVLKDTQTNDWKKRMEGLKKVQEISMLYQNIAEGNSNISGPVYMNQILKLYNPLTAQSLDLRSATAKETGKTIQVMAQVLQDDFEQLALKLVTKDSQLKLLHSGTKVLAEIGNQTIITIIMNVYTPKFLQKFYEEMKGSKNQWAHSKLALFLYIMLDTYPYEGLMDKNVQLLEQYLQLSLKDANSEARQNGRKAFLTWQKLAPYEADQLFKILDFSTQRAILEEKDLFSMSGDQKKSHTNNSNKSQSMKIQKAVVQQVEESEQPRSVSQMRKKPEIKEPIKYKQQTPVMQQTKEVKQQYPSPFSQKNPLKTQTNNFNQLQEMSNQTINTQTQYLNPFQAQQRMEIDQQTQFSYEKIFNKLKNPVWYQKAEALEDFQAHLTLNSSESLLEIFKKDKVFTLVNNQIIQLLLTDNVSKIVELSLDILEILLTALPESIFTQIDQLLKLLLKHIQSKKESISNKANDIINVSLEILTADVLLPNLIAYMEEIAHDPTLVSTKVSALEVLNILLKSSCNLNEKIQFESIVSAIGSVLERHSSQKSIQMPSLGAILELREINLVLTLESIIELPQLQVNIIKQLSNAYERSLAKQIIEFLNRQDHEDQEENENQKYQKVQQSQSIIKIIQQAQNQSQQQVLQNQTNNNRQPSQQKVSQSNQVNDPYAIINKENGSHKPQSQSKVQITTLENFKPVQVLQSNHSMLDASKITADVTMSSVIISPPVQNQQSQITQEIINCYSVLMDVKQNLQNKQNAVKILQKLNMQYKPQSHDDSWQATYESLSDCIFNVLSSPAESFQLKEICFHLLIEIIQKHPRERLTQFSKKILNTTLREKMITQTLQVYLQTIPISQSQVISTQQVQTNDLADDLLEAITFKSDMKFIAGVFGQFLVIEQPPKLQAIIRIMTSRIKAVNSGQVENEFKYETYHQIVDSLMSLVPVFGQVRIFLFFKFEQVINNQNADVRKCCVFGLVEIYAVIGEDYFQAFMEIMNPSQQKLVDIYIKRKQEMMKQEKMGNTNYYQQQNKHVM